jgi:acyl-CoA dehydrogenase
MIDYRKWNSGNNAHWYLDDPLLMRYAKRYLSENVYYYVEPAFRHTGELAAGPIDQRAAYTDRDGAPKLIRYNRKGEEINQIWQNEGYLRTLKEGYGTGVVSLRYDERAPEKLPFFANSILFYLLSQAETGFTCPVVLTQSVAYVLEKFGSEKQKIQYLNRLGNPMSEGMIQGATFLTEIQGGSDVGATRTVAIKNGNHYLLSGEKWFASNCDAQVSLVLARVSDKPGTKGLGLFLVPAILEDGSRNKIIIRRLKDKLGVRAVASGELILHDTIGYLIGEESMGFKYMAEALNVSRLGTSLAGLAIAKRSFLEGAVYASHREAFGQSVIDFSLVRETLADLMVNIEAGWAVLAPTIRMFDELNTYCLDSEAKQGLLRILLSLAKYRLSELGVSAAKESLELHGGNGYIEEYVTARLLRDAVVNPVWEGTSNIQSLEILKILQKQGCDPFIFDLRNELQKMDEPTLAFWRDYLMEETDALEHIIQQLLKQENPSAMGKKLADRMYDVYAGVHLLEEACYDLHTSGDGRRLIAVERWIRKQFIDKRNPYGSFTKTLSSEEFESLVCFRAKTC